MQCGDFNPRSPHGERPPTTTTPCAGRYFNPRSPHGERPGTRCWRMPTWRRFQSTLPARGATRPYTDLPLLFPRFQSTLPARGATYRMILTGTPIQFQSTLPARGATTSSSAATDWTKFQSTLPARGATAGHLCAIPRRADFNPRSPHGERPHAFSSPSWIAAPFQSTLPARGATNRRHSVTAYK